MFLKHSGLLSKGTLQGKIVDPLKICFHLKNIFQKLELALANKHTFVIYHHWYVFPDNQPWPSCEI